MSQSDGEPAWQGKTYNALKDKKHLTGINKEEVLLSQGKFALHAKFNAFTYKSLGLQNNNDSRFAIVINKKGRATSDPAYTILQLNLDLLLKLPPESSKLN